MIRRGTSDQAGDGAYSIRRCKRQNGEWTETSSEEDGKLSDSDDSLRGRYRGCDAGNGSGFRLGFWRSCVVLSCWSVLLIRYLRKKTEEICRSTKENDENEGGA